MQTDSRFHKFTDDELEGIDLPSLFTYPFNYVPHKLCKIASQHLTDYLNSRSDWDKELQAGKMMGVLIVKHNDNIGYLTAYSGNLAHRYNHEYFVPAVCDLLSSDGFFAPQEAVITGINKMIDQELVNPERLSAVDSIRQCELTANDEINAYKQLMKESKVRRDIMRKQGYDEATLIAESQFQKAQLRRLQKTWAERIDKFRAIITNSDNKIKVWKEERQQRSIALQRLVFDRFVMLNANGESKNLNEIFSTTTQGAPPSGAGECAAPKLLQYAYSNGYQPMAMAEFWVGKSPKDEVRHHGHFYPSCKAKCEPILQWMLQGLNVEPNPLENTENNAKIDILYEDEWIIAVDKPEGMLSVPGKLSVDSLQQRVQKMFEGEEIHIVHRLDMATSGILLFARSSEIHKRLQAMFKSHKIKKCYAAILDGEIINNAGVIDLPLVLNPNDRPRQMVSHQYGKPAITHYKTIDTRNGKTFVLFYPITGRTHQLRVHSSHCDGLNTPILGDTLYGTANNRLYLHAHRLDFKHPISGKEITIVSPIPFNRDIFGKK